MGKYLVLVSQTRHNWRKLDQKDTGEPDPAKREVHHSLLTLKEASEQIRKSPLGQKL